jgi:hypothetical protein
MSNINSNEPAYPIQPTFDNDGSVCNERYKFEGLTKRELIAAMAMQGILSCGNGVHGKGEAEQHFEYDRIAKASINYADELLNQLSK